MENLDFSRPKASVFLVVVILLLVGVAFWIASRERPVVIDGKPYSSETYKIEFIYPDSYVIAERYVGDPSFPRNAVTLYAKDNLPNPSAGEGPTAINFDIYSNSLAKTPLETWVRQSPASNFNLGNRTLIPTTVDGKSAFTYNWDGLYLGKSVVFEHNGNIIHTSVTYMSEDDIIKYDFDRLISTIRLK